METAASKNGCHTARFVICSDHERYSEETVSDDKVLSQKKGLPGGHSESMRPDRRRERDGR